MRTVSSLDESSQLTALWEELLNRPIWTRILASGLLWAAAYNGTWGLAWRAGMRREWQEAAATIGEPLPWTDDVWLAWGVVTVPLGAAMMAYVDRSTAVGWAIARATASVWLLISLGVAITAVRQGFSMRVVILDGLVNLIAIPVASVVGATALGIPLLRTPTS